MLCNIMPEQYVRVLSDLMRLYSQSTLARGLQTSLFFSKHTTSVLTINAVSSDRPYTCTATYNDVEVSGVASITVQRECI